MDVSLARRVALPYLIVGRAETFYRDPRLSFRSRGSRRILSSSCLTLCSAFAPFAIRFTFHGTAIIGSKFAALDEARDGHGRADQATRLRAWSRDIFKRTRLVLLAHHAGPRIVIRTRARTRHSLDSFSTQ